MDKFDLHAAKLNGSAGFYHIQLDLAGEAVLLELALNQPHRQAGRIHRQVYTLEQVGQRADVILVPVRNHNAADPVGVSLHKGKIGQHQVHAQHVAVRKGHAAVHNDHVILALKKRKVFTNLIQAAQEINLNRRFYHLIFCRSAALLRLPLRLRLSLQRRRRLLCLRNAGCPAAGSRTAGPALRRRVRRPGGRQLRRLLGTRRAPSLRR